MKNLVRRFVRDDGGNYAMMTGIIILPLIMGTGLAIDASNISRKHNELQHAVDAAVLAIAREGKALTDEKATEIARQFIVGNFDLALTDFKVTRTGTRVDLDANSRAQLAFGGVVGRESWPIAAKSSADIAYASYEIGLVLDTTGSMAGGKLISMKEAVNGLVDTLSGQVQDPDRLKFAMVPFSNFVNVGPQYGPSFDKKGKQIPGTGATWLDLAGYAQFPQSELGPGASRFQLYENMGESWPGCIETRYDDGNGQDVSDRTPDPSNASTLFVPALSIDEPDTWDYANSYIKSDAKTKDKSVPEMKKKWGKYGVKTDAAGLPLLGGLLSDLTGLLGIGLTPQKIKIDTSISPISRKPKGPGMGCYTQPISPLGNDYLAIKRKVDALTANGTTNITEGVSWGLRVLSKGEPFGEGKDPDKDYVEKIMIVLTDGSNVVGEMNNDLGSSYNSNGYLVEERLGRVGGGTSPTDLMNAKTLKACENAKKDGIEVYTIRLEEPNAKTGYMLKDCASDEAHFIDVPSRTQLDEAFKVIQERIVRIRISS